MTKAWIKRNIRKLADDLIFDNTLTEEQREWTIDVIKMFKERLDE